MEEDNKDILVPWEPIENFNNPPGTWFLDALHDDDEGFRFLLRDEKHDTKDLLRVSFEYTLGYRNAEEGFMIRLWHFNEKETLGKIFYTIKNSTYIEFFHYMTQEIYKEWDITHYGFYTQIDCIDVLSSTPPKVEWLD